MMIACKADIESNEKFDSKVSPAIKEWLAKELKVLGFKDIKRFSIELKNVLDFESGEKFIEEYNRASKIENAWSNINKKEGLNKLLTCIREENYRMTSEDANLLFKTFEKYILNIMKKKPDITKLAEEFSKETGVVLDTRETQDLGNLFQLSQKVGRKTLVNKIIDWIDSVISRIIDTGYLNDKTQLNKLNQELAEEVLNLRLSIAQNGDQPHPTKQGKGGSGYGR